MFLEINLYCVGIELMTPLQTIYSSLHWALLCPGTCSWICIVNMFYIHHYMSNWI